VLDEKELYKHYGCMFLSYKYFHGIELEWKEAPQNLCASKLSKLDVKILTSQGGGEGGFYNYVYPKAIQHSSIMGNRMSVQQVVSRISNQLVFV
jgi:hypothetical protein